MKSKLLLLLLPFCFLACPKNEPDGNKWTYEEIDEKIIESGTKFDDFKGHANSLSWLADSVWGDGDKVGMKFYTKDGVSYKSEANGSGEAVISEIKYINSDNVGTKYPGKKIDKFPIDEADLPFYVFVVKDEATYIIKKVSNSHFKLGNSTFETWGSDRYKGANKV